MRSERAFAAANDVALLMVAVLGFSMFFGSLTEAYLRREAANRARVLEDMASSLLAAVIDDPRWTVEHAVFVAWKLANATSSDVSFAANGHPFQVVVLDLAERRTWMFEVGEPVGDRRVASAPANVIARSVDPARVTATVWGR